MIRKIKSFLVGHYRIILVALFIGVISSLPQYLAQSSRLNFQGMYVGVANDMSFYQARARDIIDGHIFLTNPYLAEHKTGAPMQFWIPDYILAKPIQWLGLSVPLGFIIWTFFLTFILTIISYFILLILTKSRNWSFLGAVLLHLGIFGNQFLRLPPPGLTFIFWLVALLSMLLCIEKDGRWGWLSAAFFFGMLFNIYPYYWTYYVIFYVVFVVLSFVLGLPWKKYVRIFLVGLIVAIPFLISTWQSLQMPWYAESSRRLGMIATHFPSGVSSVVVCGIAICLFLWAYRKKIIAKNSTTILLFSGFLAGIIAVNQQIITGQNVEFSSHYILGSEFMVVFGIFYVLVLWLKVKSEKFQKIFLILGFAIVFVISVFGVFSIIKPQLAYNQEVVDIQN